MGLTRSQQMARIRSQDTQPERLLRKALWRRGLRYRLKYKVTAGRPDLVFPGPRVVVFVDGCFWHGCPAHYVPPRSRGDYWSSKLLANVKRDVKQTRLLEDAGWKTVRVWECEVEDDVDGVVDHIERAVRHGEEEATRRWRVYEVEWLDDEGNLEKRKLLEIRGLSPAMTEERPRSFVEQSTNAKDK